MGSVVADSWMYTTMQIENQWNQLGTGFLVVRHLDDKYSKIFLVTNKHVLHKEAESRLHAKYIDLHFTITEPDGSMTGKSGRVVLDFDGSKIWREHPNTDVDVLAFDVTQVIINIPQITKKLVGYDSFSDLQRIKELDITAGDEILVVGYPLGLRQGETNLPLVRGGIISTRIGEVFEDDYNEQDGTIRRRSLRGFLIDGATIPGSSGSPVILKPISGRRVEKTIRMKPAPAILLGIVAETRYAPINVEGGYILSFAGLGLAFDAETIKETIELFFK